MNIISTKVKLLLIRYRINLAIQVPNVRQIIIITDAILAARCIFDLSNYLFQLHSIVIFQDLRAFFDRNSNNTISFWDCSSSNKWPSHLAVDKKTKQLKINPIFLCKSSWDFSKKEEYNIILKNWQITFQTSDYKRKNLLGTLILYIHELPELLQIMLLYVVATTRQNGTHSLFISAKLSIGYLVVEITRELNKEPLLHCSSIYINYI